MISDEELAALALAADVDEPLGPDAVPWSPDRDADAPDLLPDWYMPAVAAGLGVGAHRGWRRRVAVVLIAAFVLINAAGLCSTYGWVVLA